MHTPTPGEQAAREALAESVRINRTEVQLAGETIELLRSEMKAAVAHGIDQAMTVERARAFWAVGLDMLQQQARIGAGRFVLDGMWSLLKRVFWVAIFMVAVYTLGGWSLVVSTWKAIFAAKS